jgi:hypothetical protein
MNHLENLGLTYSMAYLCMSLVAFNPELSVPTNDQFRSKVDFEGYEEDLPVVSPVFNESSWKYGDNISYSIPLNTFSRLQA